MEVWERDSRGFHDGRFVDVVAPLSTCAITEYFAAQGMLLREGQHAEAGARSMRLDH